MKTGPYLQRGTGLLAELEASQQRAHFTADILCVVTLAAPACTVPANIRVSAVAAAAAAMRFMAEFLPLGRRRGSPEGMVGDDSYRLEGDFRPRRGWKSCLHCPSGAAAGHG